MEIQFGDGSPKHKPPQKVIDRLHEAVDWSWKSADRVWALPFTEDSARAKHIEAERLFEELRQLLRQEKGLDASPDVPF